MEREQVSLTPRSEEPQASNHPIGDWLDELCVFYMAIGVSYSDFWDGDYARLPFFRKAYERRFEMENERHWLQGLYFNAALEASLAQFGFSLGGGKGKRPEAHYPEAPFAFTEGEKAAEKARNIERTRRWFERGQNS